MAIVKMKRLEIIGLNSERKQILEYLQRFGAVDISDKEDTLSAPKTAGAISQFEADMAQTASALEILERYTEKQGGFFYQKPAVSDEDISLAPDEIAEMKALSKETADCKRLIEQNVDKIAALEGEAASLGAYMELDLPLSLKGTEDTLIRVGTLGGEVSEQRLWQMFSDEGVELVYPEILSSEKTQTAVWILYHQSCRDGVERVLSRLNFTAASGNLSGEIPKAAQSSIESRISALREESAGSEKRLGELSKNADRLRLYYDKIALRRDKYEALSKVGLTERTFFLAGYIPDKLAPQLEKELNGLYTVSVEFFEPSEGEEVPKTFKNNSFVAPVEGITSDYSMPASHDIDPNPVMAFFYYLFFGMMFSDAGYGLLMMIACGLLGYGNFIEREKRRAYKMFFLCGISTTFWGLMYGSFFGDMIAVVSNTFGSGKLALKPILFDPVKKPLELLIISVALGLLHILTALAVKLYMSWRSGDKKGAIFDTGFWIILLSGIGIFALGLKTVGIVMITGSAAGLILTQGRDKKNPVMKLFGGILSLYDITSYVGDVLSYSRLMALGLATGVIASVVNVLGSLGGNSAVGIISFIVISLFGHTLNFAINMLGAYVHTNRLQYVEFYQKFYEGGGKRYKPFKYNTRYFNFK